MRQGYLVIIYLPETINNQALGQVSQSLIEKLNKYQQSWKQLAVFFGSMC